MACLTPVEANLSAQQFAGGLVCSRKTLNSCEFKGQHESQDSLLLVLYLWLLYQLGFLLLIPLLSKGQVTQQQVVTQALNPST